ncbi:unnamed protein product [Larinioides sclopetarius]|uniref:Uncharacterized protein n=1 Tax=Larinioides sclopetarius TaxID=280406 RepID=A0AAV1Z3J3_9ARAC
MARTFRRHVGNCSNDKRSESMDGNAWSKDSLEWVMYKVVWIVRSQSVGAIVRFRQRRNISESPNDFILNQLF